MPSRVNVANGVLSRPWHNLTLSKAVAARGNERTRAGQRKNVSMTRGELADRQSVRDKMQGTPDKINAVWGEKAMSIAAPSPDVAILQQDEGKPHSAADLRRWTRQWHMHECRALLQLRSQTKLAASSPSRSKDASVLGEQQGVFPATGNRLHSLVKRDRNKLCS